MNADAAQCTGAGGCLTRGRGRPPKTHDNSRVQAALTPWFIYAGSGVEDHGTGDDRPQSLTGMSWLDDILTGASRMQTEGQKSTRPLDRGVILRALLRCKTIDPTSVAEAIGRGHGRAQTDRYTAAARVASKGVAAAMDRRPAWVQQVADDAAHMAGLDAMWPMT
ncbi:MAG: hypothetical protein U1C47_03590 [Hydrogenophaga sp.]|nr:hypothetical protein [Hydrogenophaga sp.]